MSKYLNNIISLKYKKSIFGLQKSLLLFYKRKIERIFHTRYCFYKTI
nr:MAG TPA: hypothetical protein [Caudoviricetes sp.]